MRNSRFCAAAVAFLAGARAFGVCGDLTFDGVCDQADLAQLLAAYGINHGGDLDGDWDTDQSDLALMLAHYGQSDLIEVSVGALTVPSSITAGSMFDMQFQLHNASDCWTCYYPPFEIFWSADDELSADDFLLSSSSADQKISNGG